MNWDEFFVEDPTKKKKVNWGDLIGDPNALNTQVVAPADNTQMARPASNMMFIQPYIDKGLDLNMAVKARKIVHENQIDDLYNLALDETNHNPLKVLTMADTESSMFDFSTNKLARRAKEKGLSDHPDDIKEVISKIKEDVPKMMGQDWASRVYAKKDKSVAVASDVSGAVADMVTEDAYAYCGKFLDDVDKKKAEIKLKIEAEEKKPVEERDNLGIAAMRQQMGSLRKNYLDENGEVVDINKATPEQKAYIDSVEKYFKDFEGLLNVSTDEQESAKKTLEKAFYDQYFFAGAMDELHGQEVAPTLDAWMKQAQEQPTPPVYSKAQKDIIDQRRDATAKLAALSKLYLANTSPADVQKNFKYYGQEVLKGLSTGLLGSRFTDVIEQDLGPAERTMLDTAQEIMYQKGLPVSEEIQDKFDRSVGEIALEGASSMVGMLPYLAMGNGFINAAKIATGYDLISAGWKGGDVAKAAGIAVDKSNQLTKVMATMADMAIEEIKLAPMGFAPGTGSGFVLSGKVMPKVGFTNPWANALYKFATTPLVVTSSMYGAKVTESAVESVFSYKPYNDILTENFGDDKEFYGTLLSNILWGFGGNKTISKDRYPDMKARIESLKKEGKVGEAAVLQSALKTFELQDKAAKKAYKKGKYAGLSEEKIYEEMKSAEEKVAAERAVKAQVELEQQNVLERIVPPERVSTVLKGSKIRDEKGELIPMYHGTDAVFNRFAKGLQKPSSGSKANSRANRLTFFSADQEMARSFGQNVEMRYINSKKPYDLKGSVRKLTEKKIQEIEDQGYDAIKGKEKGTDGKWHDVVATFGTQGIVKAEELLPFKSKNAETLRSWANTLRSKEMDMSGVHLSSVLPVDLKKAGKVAVEVMAKTLEAGASMIEAIEKGFIAVQEHSWYKKLDPDTQAKFDPLIRDRLQKLFEQAKPEVVAKYDKGTAERMVTEATSKYLPEFTKQGEALAAELGGEFIPSVKSAESIIGKKQREGLTDVLDVSDVVRGALVVKDLSEFKDVSKRLKKEGYTISNKRVGNSKTGYRGVVATKRQGELGTEIQLHTKETLEAQQKADAIRDKYRANPVAEPKVSTIKPPAPYVSDAPRKGSINLNTTDKPENDRFAEPHTDYEEANGASVHTKTKNLWVKPSTTSNTGRILMGQFTSKLMGTTEEQTNKASEYYASIYRYVPGYNRAQDFWEIPQWQAALSGSFKNADTYVIRDVAEAKEFIEKSGYKEVAFSVLDVTKEKVKALAEQLPDIKFNIGGYVDMAGYFKDNPNVKIFDSIEGMAKDHGVPYKPEYDYRNFKGTAVIPRLQLSTGCKYQCAFCSIPKKVEAVDKAVIDKQVEALKDLKSSYIYLDDKTFGQANNFTYLSEIYKKLKANDPDFQGFIIQTTSRDFADPKKFSPEFIKESGIKFVELGVEIYDDAVLSANNKQHSHKKYTDAAMQNARESGVKVIPNLIVGFKEATKESYENTLKFLEDNKDIISHANIYNLAIYESTPLAKNMSPEELAEASSNENVQSSPFHAEYGEKLLDAAKEIVRASNPELRYQDDMAESRKLYDEAYAGLDDINLEGSPAKTPLEKKMRAIELPVSIQKDMKKAWTETKQKMMDEIRAANSLTSKEKKDQGFPAESVKDQFKDFIKELPLAGLNIHLKKAMLNKVNQIDFLKPASLPKAIEYFDKIVDNATFRLQLIETEKAYNNLDHYTSDEYLVKKDVNGIMKNKIGPTGLALRDELKDIRRDMVEGDWNTAQDAIQDLLQRYTDVDRELTDKEYNHIVRLNFRGLLNPSNGATLTQMQGAVRDLKDIIKTGKTKAAAERMIKREAMVELEKRIFDVLDGKPGKPVVLDQQIATNQRVSLATQYARYLNWMQMDSWFTLLDKFSKYDKTSDPYKSELNKVMGGAVLEADLNDFTGKQQKYTEVQDKFKEIFGVSSDSKLRKLAQEHTKTLHKLEYKDISGVDKSMDITMNQAYKVWMELQDPTLEKANEAGGYMRDGELTDKGQQLEKMLTPEIKAWAKWQLEEFYPEYYKRVNEVYRRVYGTDMPMGQNYSPIFVAEKTGVKEGGDIDNMLANQNVLNSASNASLKTRVNHAKPLALIDGDKVLMNYIDKMEFFVNWSDAISLLNDTFVRNGDIRAALRQNFGPTSLQVVDNFINDFSRTPKDLNRVSAWADTWRKNFTVASLAIKPTVFFAQLTAMPAYLEQVPVLEWTKNFGKMLVDWKTTGEIFDRIKEDPFWKERYQKGWDRDVVDAMLKDLQAINSRGALGKFKDTSMFLTKYGDMGAILVGGIPLYRYQYEKTLKETGSEKLARTVAMSAFADATRNSQQAGQVYDLSVVQRANSFTKLLTMYKTSPFQYHRKVVGAVRNLTQGRGDVSGNLKSIFIYHVLLPQLFQMVGNGFKWDKKDQLQALVLGNFNEVFVAGDVLKGIMNTVRGLPFPYQITPVESTARSAQNAVQHLDQADVIKAVLDQEENVSMEDLLKAVEDMAKVAGDVSGMPVRGAYAIGKGVYDVSSGAEKDKDIVHKAARILGWSEASLQPNSNSIFDDDVTSKKVKDLMDNTKVPTFNEIYELQDIRDKGKKTTAPAKKTNKKIPDF